MTATPEQLRALAARCEAATGADRELDVAIYIADRPYPCVELHPEQQREADFKRAPAYTGSTDAAISLVPEGCGHGYDEDANGFSDKQIRAWINQSAELWTTDGWPHVHASTPALALTAAALKARAVMMEVERD